MAQYNVFIAPANLLLHSKLHPDHSTIKSVASLAMSPVNSILQITDGPHWLGTNIHIPTEELVNQMMIAAAVLPTHFGPYQNGDAGTCLVHVHQAIYVVPQLFPFLVNMEDKHPMEAVMCMASQVQSLGLMAKLQELVLWLLACTTRVAGPPMVNASRVL
jgi:hypothetical protein